MEKNEQLEFNFGCSCNETTSYADLCPSCINEYLEYTSSLGTELDEYEEYA